MTGLRDILKAMPCSVKVPAIYYILANVFVYTRVRRPSTARCKTLSIWKSETFQGRIQDFSQGRAPSDGLVHECIEMVYFEW